MLLLKHLSSKFLSLYWKFICLCFQKLSDFSLENVRKETLVVQVFHFCISEFCKHHEKFTKVSGCFCSFVSLPFFIAHNNNMSQKPFCCCCTYLKSIFVCSFINMQECRRNLGEQKAKKWIRKGTGWIKSRPSLLSI